MSIAVCRRVEDGNVPGTRDVCQQCHKEVIVESGLEVEEIKVCIHCAALHNPEHLLFVELPPDEFGHSSMSVGLKEVFEKDGGTWHKHGVWHNAQWVIARQE